MFTAEQLRMEMLRRATTSRPSSDDIALLTNEELLVQILESNLLEREKLLYRTVIADSWANSLNYNRALQELNDILQTYGCKQHYPEIFALTQLKKTIISFSQAPDSFEASLTELDHVKNFLRDYSNPDVGNPALVSMCIRCLGAIDYSQINMILYMAFRDSFGETTLSSKITEPRIEYSEIRHYIVHDDYDSELPLRDYAVRFATDSDHLYEMAWLRKHLVLLRYMVHTDDSEASEARSAYCDVCLRRKSSAVPLLSHGYANPWEFIELYRALLLEKMAHRFSDNSVYRSWKRQASERVKAAYGSVCNHPYPYMGLKQCIIQTYLKGSQLYLTGKKWEKHRVFQKNLEFLKKCSLIRDETDLKQHQTEQPYSLFRYEILPDYETTLKTFQVFRPRAWGGFDDYEPLQKVFCMVVPFILW